MDFSKKQIATFYIEKNKGVLYTTNFAKPFVVQFPQDVISNLEVIDKSKFQELLSNFIAKSKLSPMSVFVVLTHDVTLEKELKDVPLSLQSAETEKFLDMVLFHQILTKTYSFSNKTIIVAANKDLCENIVSVFQENLFPVAGIIPLSILEEKFSQIKEKLDEKFVLKKIENLKKYFLPLGIGEPEKILTYNAPSLKNPQLIILVSIFVLLLVILGVQSYTHIFQSESSSKINTSVTKKNIPTPTPNVASPSATLTPEETFKPENF